tara:strand:+ start:206 stop:613 length:408 start_codon:yes stop_codon:yes gene_type:complete
MKKTILLLSLTLIISGCYHQKNNQEIIQQKEKVIEEQKAEEELVGEELVGEELVGEESVPFYHEDDDKLFQRDTETFNPSEPMFIDDESDISNPSINEVNPDYQQDLEMNEVNPDYQQDTSDTEGELNAPSAENL